MHGSDKKNIYDRIIIVIRRLLDRGGVERKPSAGWSDFFFVLELKHVCVTFILLRSLILFYFIILIFFYFFDYVARFYWSCHLGFSI